MNGVSFVIKSGNYLLNINIIYKVFIYICLCCNKIICVGAVLKLLYILNSKPKFSQLWTETFIGFIYWFTGIKMDQKNYSLEKLRISKLSTKQLITKAYYINDKTGYYFHDILKLKEETKGTMLYLYCENGKYFMETVKPLLPKSMKNIVCVDGSESYIKEANNHFNNPDIVFRHMNIEATRLNRNEQFDYVMSYWKMHLVKNRLQTFRNIYSLLKPGGCVFLIYVADSQFMKIFRRLAANQMWYSFLGGDINCFTPSEGNAFSDIYENLKAAGFHRIKFERSKNTNLYGTEKEFKSEFDDWNIFKNKIPKKYQKEFYKQFLNEMRIESRLDFGDYSFTNIFLPVDNVVVKMVANKPF